MDIVSDHVVYCEATVSAAMGHWAWTSDARIEYVMNRISGLIPSSNSSCFQDGSTCMQDCARLDTAAERSTCGLDCALDLAECISDVLIGDGDEGDDEVIEG